MNVKNFNIISERNVASVKDKLIIIGASGHGKVAADIAIKMNKWKSIAFLDDDNAIDEALGLKNIGKTVDAMKYKDESEFFIAIGNNTTREKIQEKFINEGLSMVSLIHPSAVIGFAVEIGIGTAVMAGVVINSLTKIGKGCVINTSCSIDHDNVIEDYVHISPGAKLAGTVGIGKGSWIGIGSIVSNNLNVCSDCKIGAGAVVVKNITEPGVYVGVPARKMMK
ncbi:sugar O-acyltransferase (sialic acid O-acetyltransferase NeuD family) [Ruminiclostridium sufflavum DSM 19573]|uniref:Sugar O-acyltransferase (Sialic acid O-acetyltransferase NeuD family) n=1 Tax=Ruminiclostridium sufflavum DSM 19573 TaxID=1121337 RepID=A0A318XLB0_9FIRM|nr:acetyltransferase [Ruminiclostridium sufflavum]PYG87163.1 sugar O-acyltransferase (sialic acid O-acetyltransferase NeuD family) [Ruminiclostridium sufflavum DSM 19573]